MTKSDCYCGSMLDYDACCGGYISGRNNAPTAEALMRSRYSAYVVRNADYLWQTTALKVRRHHSKSNILQWAKANHWVRLEVLNFSEDTVEFKAYYLDSRLQAQVHHEKSRFVREAGIWYYLDGD